MTRVVYARISLIFSESPDMPKKGHVCTWSNQQEPALTCSCLFNHTHSQPLCDQWQGDDNLWTSLYLSKTLEYNLYYNDGRLSLGCIKNMHVWIRYKFSVLESKYMCTCTNVAYRQTPRMYNWRLFTTSRNRKDWVNSLWVVDGDSLQLLRRKKLRSFDVWWERWQIFLSAF